VDANVRYVGALSRKLDSTPEPQKNCHGRCRANDWPNSSRCPLPHAFRINSAGVIVTKMPANKTATSTMGDQPKRLRSRLARAVVHHAPAASAISADPDTASGHDCAPAK